MIAFLPPYILHPLSSAGASFYGGIGGDIGELTLAASIATGILVRYRQHNCHIRRCWRLAWHPHPETGHPVCRHHHPDHHKNGGTT